MNIILAATDFTPSSLNACLYGAMLAKKLKCKLVVFNLSELPVAHANNGLYFISYNTLKENSDEKMLKTLQEIKQKFPKLPVQSLVISGGFKDEITRFLKQHKVQSVVMGLGAKTKLAKFIFGSHSTDIAGKLTAPVIIVPEKFKVHSAKNIILSVDNNEALSHQPLVPFEKMTGALHAKVKMLHVRTEDELFHPAKLQIQLHHKPHKVEAIFAKSIQEGVNLYRRKNNSDMVAVISKSHSSLYDLFAESTTKKIAFTSKVPVMAIHE